MIQTPFIRSICAANTIGSLQSLMPLSKTLLATQSTKGSAKVTKEQLQKLEFGKEKIRTRDSIRYFEQKFKQRKVR